MNELGNWLLLIALGACGCLARELSLVETDQSSEAPRTVDRELPAESAEPSSSSESSEAGQGDVTQPQPTEADIVTAEGEDWPCFLGPQHNGVSKETGVWLDWPPQGPPILWHRKIGEGYGPPSVIKNRLIVQHRVRDDEIVECLDAHTGETLWKYSYPTEFVDPYGYNGGTRCAPVLTPDFCYTFGPQGKLLCLELNTGSKVWECDTQREFDVPEHFFGAGCTPLLDGPRLIVLVGGQPNAAVVAFDAKTGQKLWQNGGRDTWDGAPMEEQGGRPYRWRSGDMLVSYSSPLIATIHGQRHLLCLVRQGLLSLVPETGDLRFRYWFRARVHESVNAARPVVVDDYVFLSAAYETGAALLQVHPDGRHYTIVWRRPDGMSTHWSTAIHYQGYLYGFSGRHERDGMLQCVDLKTGKLQWQSSGFEGDLNNFEMIPETPHILRDRTTGRKAPWPFYGRGSAILVDGHLIVLGERGTLAVVKPNPDRWEEVRRACCLNIHPPSWAAPVLSRGRLYIRTERDLVALDLRPRH
ncbi:MAG: serine/threonine protein kinase [Planctomycetaceae bacterium]|nr:MAG: serine/threonine protein kinase [Planctomycetaceae bacterium]